MWNLLRNVGVAMRLVSSSDSSKNEDEESRILEVLEASDSEDDDSAVGPEDSCIESDLSNHKTGYVTHLLDNGSAGVIDGLYHFDLSKAPVDIAVGDRVSYVAFCKNGSSVWTVKNVYLVSNEEWGGSDGVTGDKTCQNKE